MPHAPKGLPVLVLVLVAACSGSGENPGSGTPGVAGTGASGTTGAAGAAQAGATGTTGGAGAAQAGTTGSAGTGEAGTTGAAGATTGAAGASVPDAGSTDAREAGTVADALPLPMSDAGKLQECPTPSIDRLTSWNATMGEGDMVPSGGSLLVKEGDHYVAKVTLNGTGWHVLPVYLTNPGGNGMVDLTTSMSFTMTYSTTADLWIQMRPANHWNGGVQWVQKIPSSGGVLQTRTFSLAAASWSYLSQLGGMPSWPYEEARSQVRAFVIVGNMPNTVVFTGLRFDNYVPVCR